MILISSNLSDLFLFFIFWYLFFRKTFGNHLRIVLGIRVDAEGEEHLESYEGGYILCPNHQSSLDTMCIAR